MEREKNKCECTTDPASDIDKKESEGRDPPEGVAPLAHRGVVVWVDRIEILVNIPKIHVHKWKKCLDIYFDH